MKVLKKVLFFWLIINLIAYISFLIGFNPSIDYKDDYGKQHQDYFLTPKYSETIVGVIDLNGNIVERHKMFPMCNSCTYSEEENFWPFHKFTYGIYGGSNIKGFVGVFGFYGHLEFAIYIILPFVIYIFTLIYKKFIR